MAAKNSVKRSVPRRGRPRIEIDYDVLDAHCQLMGTGKQCALACGISFDTLTRALKRDKGMAFAEYLEIASAPALLSLRSAQFEVAIKDKNVSMLQFLGKNYLSQTDKHHTEHSGSLDLSSLSDDDLERKVIETKQALDKALH